MAPHPRFAPFLDPLALLCKQFQVRELSAFGSVLREDFSEDSDIDLIVEFLPNTRVGLFHMIRFQRALEQLLQRPVDLVPKDGLKPMIRAEVLESSEPLYAA